MLGVVLLGDSRHYKWKKKATQITVFTAKEIPRTKSAFKPQCPVATEKWEGAYEKGEEELPRSVRSSQPCLDSFIFVGWMLLV